MSHSRCGAAGVAQQVLHSRCGLFTYRVRGCPKFLQKSQSAAGGPRSYQQANGRHMFLEQQAASRKQEAKTSNERQDGLPSTPPPPRGHHQKGALDIIFCETQRVTLPEISGPSRARAHHIMENAKHSNDPAVDLFDLLTWDIGALLPC